MRINARFLRRVLALAFLLLVWEGLSRLGVIDPFYAPPPTRIAGVIVSLFDDGEIWQHLQATFTAALVGLVAGLVLGILLGFAAALVPVLAELLEPVMILLNAIPRVILAPLFVIWLGIGLASKVALALILVAVLIFFAVYSGIKEVDHRLVERVRTLGGGRGVLIREVYIPSVTAWCDGQPQSCRRLRLHWRRGRRVRGLQPRPRLPAAIRAEHLQRGSDICPDPVDHGFCAGALRALGAARAAPAALAIRLSRSR